MLSKSLELAGPRNQRRSSLLGVDKGTDTGGKGGATAPTSNGGAMPPPSTSGKLAGCIPPWNAGKALPGGNPWRSVAQPQVQVQLHELLAREGEDVTQLPDPWEEVTLVGLRPAHTQREEQVPQQRLQEPSPLQLPLPFSSPLLWASRVQGGRGAKA